MKTWRWLAIGLAYLATAVGSPALAAGPEPWQLYFSSPASPVMERIIAFHDLLLWVEIPIVLLVLVLMLYIIFRFNAKANPQPSKTTHNTALEVIWTVIPIIILVIISVPSMKLLFFMDKLDRPGITDKADMTLKVISHQWYWSYEYPDDGNFTFDANLVPAEDLKPGQPRLLQVDNPVVLPVDTNIRIQVTSDDVIHNWALPAGGIKIDSVPGRINETWIRIPAEHAGTYYGQCSELCGVNHGFMPITVEAVSKEDFAKWVEKAKEKFAAVDTPAAVQVARARDAR